MAHVLHSTAMMHVGMLRIATTSSTDPRCPYDPYGDKQYHIYKDKDDCACLYHGGELPANLISSYPATNPGQYAQLPNVRIYGTSCAAWDQFPGTPHFPQCRPDSDWCHSNYNWCQLPWCFVSSKCATRVASDTFSGAGMYLSYDTCLSTPDCKTFPYDSKCPFDALDTGWSTPQVCETSWSDVCKCSFQLLTFACSKLSFVVSFFGGFFLIFPRCFLAAVVPRQCNEYFVDSFAIAYRYIL